jgi:hypothetical protein
MLEVFRRYIVSILIASLNNQLKENEAVNYAIISFLCLPLSFKHFLSNFFSNTKDLGEGKTTSHSRIKLRVRKRLKITTRVAKKTMRALKTGIYD